MWNSPSSVLSRQFRVDTWHPDLAAASQFNSVRMNRPNISLKAGNVGDT